MQFLFAEASWGAQVAALAAVARNARRAGLLATELHSDQAVLLARALVLSGAIHWAIKADALHPRAFVLSGDFDFTRLLLGFVATRSTAPVVLVLHDYGSRWPEATAPWISSIRYSWVIAHDARHVTGLIQRPGAVCLAPGSRSRRFRSRLTELTVGIVVDALVAPLATVELAAAVARSAEVERALIRLHPRARDADWPPLLPDHVEYADRHADIAQFADEIDVAITSATTARNILMRAGIPCYSWDGFYSGMPQAFTLSADTEAAPCESEAFGVPLARLVGRAPSADDDGVAIEEMVDVSGLLRGLGL